MQPAGSYRKTQILRFHKERAPLNQQDRVIREEPLEIRLVSGSAKQTKSKSFGLTMRTPGQDYELAAGLLFSEGVIHKKTDLLKMTYCVSKAEQTYNLLNVRLRPGLKINWKKHEQAQITQASCGLCGKAQIEHLQTQLFPDFGQHEPLLDPDVIYGLSAQMRPQQKLFQQTGAVHAAALFDLKGQILSLHEDIGRHNALDKLIGKAFLDDQLPLIQNLAMTSGRIGFDLVQKCLRASIPVLIGVGAPSSLAIELAQVYDMTLIGFVKTESFNVYSGFQRFKTS